MLNPAGHYIDSGFSDKLRGFTSESSTSSTVTCTTNKYLTVMPFYDFIGNGVFTSFSALGMGRANCILPDSTPNHKSDHPCGGSRLILLPGFLLDTIFMDAESHMKNSLNISPFSFKGSRTDI